MQSHTTPPKPARKFFLPKHLAVIFAIILLPVLGYFAMRLLPEMFSMGEGSTGSHLLVTVLIIAIGLAVPYWMLKAFIHQAHEYDPAETEFDLKDIPKDKQDLARDIDNGTIR